MATVGGSGVITLTDYAKTLDPESQKTADVIEILAKASPLIKDVPMMEGNLDVGHRHTRRGSLPSVSWRVLNSGTAKTKGTTVQVDDQCGIMEAVCDVDAKIADLNGNRAKFRWSQDQAHIEAMAQEAEQTFFYGNQATDPEEFTGFAPRYALGDTAGDSGTYKDQLINGGGTGTDNTSIWLVNWGENKVFGIYPKGMKAGLDHEDRGLIDLYDASNNPYRGYRSYYSWDLGLAIADWRQVVRIANIDVSALVADDGTVSAGANLITSMIKAIHRLPVVGAESGQKVFYVNKTAYLYLDLQTLKQTQMNIKYGKDQHGHEVLMFRGIPVRLSEQILDNESAITFG
jgi:hypothetical protein